VTNRQVEQEIPFLTFHVEITVIALDKTTLGQGASLFWFRRLAIKMGFVIAYDSNQPCN